MRKSSRFMPQYKPRKASKTILVATLSIFLALVIFKPIFLGIIAGIFLLVFIWGKFERPKSDSHFKKLSEERSNLSICQFAREFDTKSVDTWVIRATYEQLQAALPVEFKVPIKATDNLLQILKVDGEDLELDLAEQIAQRTGRTLDNSEMNPYYGKVVTVNDLVLFFNHQEIANAT